MEENDANLYCERYVDFTDPTIRNLMKERMKIARDAGCDGVDPDNIDISGIKWGNGRNPPSPKSVFEALTDLAAYAHSMTSTYKGYKFMIGQKNAPEMAKDLAAKFDFAVLERGLEKNFAQEFIPYFNLKKPVIDIEYPADLLNEDDKNQPCNLQRDSSCAMGDTKCLCRGLNAPLDKMDRIMKLDHDSHGLNNCTQYCGSDVVITATFEPAAGEDCENGFGQKCKEDPERIKNMCCEGEEKNRADLA